MRVSKILRINFNHLRNLLFLILIILSFTTLTLNKANIALALDPSEGKDIFSQNCSGCHINGGNIVRRNKTLKLKDLKRNNLDSPEAIAKVARQGIGIMSGYESFLQEGEDKIVANWIWQQSQNAWTQG